MNTVKIAIVLFAGTAEGFKDSTHDGILSNNGRRFKNSTHEGKLGNNGRWIWRATTTENTWGQNLWNTWGQNLGLGGPPVKAPAAPSGSKPAAASGSKPADASEYTKKEGFGCAGKGMDWFPYDKSYTEKQAVEECNKSRHCIGYFKPGCDPEKGQVKLCRGKRIPSEFETYESTFDEERNVCAYQKPGVPEQGRYSTHAF